MWIRTPAGEVLCAKASDDCVPGCMLEFKYVSSPGVGLVTCHTRPAEAPEVEWQCEICTLENPAGSLVCGACGGVWK